MSGGILALDISTSTGYAHSEAGAPIYSGTKRFLNYGARHGKLMSDFFDWIDELTLFLKPTLLIWEAPIIGGGDLNKHLLLMGLSGIVDMVGHRQGCHKTEIVNHSTVKKSFAGHGHAKKDQMMEAARLRGFDPKDDNEADALAVLCYGAGKYNVRIKYPDVRRIAGQTLFSRNS